MLKLNLEDMSIPIIKRVYSQLSDEELELMIREINDLSNTGVLGSDTRFRALIKEIAEITDTTFSVCLLGCQVSVLTEFAHRKLNINNE